MSLGLVWLRRSLVEINSFPSVSMSFKTIDQTPNNWDQNCQSISWWSLACSFATLLLLLKRGFKPRNFKTWKWMGQAQTLANEATTLNFIYLQRSKWQWRSLPSNNALEGEGGRIGFNSLYCVCPIEPISWYEEGSFWSESVVLVTPPTFLATKKWTQNKFLNSPWILTFKTVFHSAIYIMQFEYW